MPSGQIVACDPLVSPDMDPFVNKVIPGKYLVELNIVHYLDDGDERIGAVVIKFKKSRAVRWEIALKEGQDPSVLKRDEIFGYPVDSGIGCFMDYETFQKYIDILKENPQYDDLLLEEMKKTMLKLEIGVI